MTGIKLLDPGLAGRLEGYRLVRTRPVGGGYAGARRSPRKGGAVEFADYREYTAGDEPRRVDWKAYARLGRLYVKEYLDERQDAVLFIVDTSASMDWGAGEEHKGMFALQLAAGLGTCVLAGSDRLAAVVGSGPGLGNGDSRGPSGSTRDDVPSGSLPGEADESTVDKAEQASSGGSNGAESVLSSNHGSPWRAFAPAEGRRSLPRLWYWLGETEFAGGTDLAGGLREGLRFQPGTTSLYVISDLLDPAGVEDMLRLAAGRGIVVTLLHVLAPGELEPPGEGEWTMVDSETGQRVEVSLTPSALRDYTIRLEQYVAALDASCRRWNARRVQLNSGRSMADVLLRDLPRAGVLKS